MVAARAAATGAGVAWLLALPLTAMYQLGGGTDSLVKGSTWSALPSVQYVVTALVRPRRRRRGRAAR